MPVSQIQPALRTVNEFLVNEPADTLGRPSVAGLTDGRFLITWAGLLGGSDGGESSNNSDILARAFAADGSALGPDFLVNREIRDGQFTPVAAGRADGSYVVAYSSGEENNLPGTYAASQLLTASGAPIGAEVFNAYSYYNYAPAVGVLPGGGYVVTSTQENDFEAQVHSADGTIVNDFRFGLIYTGGFYSAVTQTGPDSFELFWYGERPQEPQEFEPQNGYYAQAATSAGLVGEPILLSSDALGNTVATLVGGDIVVGGFIFDPDTQAIVGGSRRFGNVAALSDGGYVIVSNSFDNDGAGIRAQLFNADGNTRGASFVVNQETAGNQTNATVAALGNDDFVVSWTGPDGIKATVFSADDVGTFDPVGTLVNTTTTGDQFTPSVARLDNGGYVVVWRDDSGLPTDNNNDIRGQLFDAAGAKVGAEFLVNTTRLEDDYSPSVTAAPGGGFTVAWIHAEEDLVPPPGPAFQRFDASGAKVGPEIFVPSGFAGSPEVASIGGGRTVVIFNDVDSQTGIYGVIYKQNGAIAGQFGIDDRYGHSSYDVAGLREGGFVLAYAAPDEAFADQPNRVHVAYYSGTGALISDRIVAPAEAIEQGAPTIAALPDGGYVVTWNESGEGSTGVRAQVYDVDGAAVGGVIAVSNGGGGNDVAALADGRFVVTWTDSAVAGQTIHEQVFTVQGDRSGDAQLIAYDSTFPALAAVAGAGDGLVITFNEDGGAGGDGSGLAVRAVGFDADPLIRGTTASETLAGGDASDTIYAAIGNDIVNAGAGNDLVYGENGVDTIHGDAGDDRLYGGFQGDSLFGDTGRDTIVGDIADVPEGSRAAHDTIDGGDDADNLYGDAFTIRAGGFGGRDTILGGRGDDIIWGDARTLEAGATGGNDTIFGGGANDIIYGDGQFEAAGAIGGNDRIDGGAGNDDLWGGGGNDLFVYGVQGFDTDMIHDFGQVAGNRDLLDLRGLGLNFAALQISYEDGNAFVDAAAFGAGRIELLGVQSLSAADFLL